MILWPQDYHPPSGLDLLRTLCLETLVSFDMLCHVMICQLFAQV